MIYSLEKELDNKIEKEQGISYSEVEDVYSKIREIKEETSVMKEVFNRINILGKEQMGYDYLIENVDIDLFNKIVYATFINNMVLDSSCYDNIVSAYIENIFKLMEKTKVEKEYCYYEHPCLWNMLIKLIINNGKQLKEAV